MFLALGDILVKILLCEISEIVLLIFSTRIFMVSYRTWKKEIEEHTNKWKHMPCSWIVKINVITMSILPKAIYRFNAIPIKISMAYFTDLEQIFKNLYGTKKDPE